MTGVQTVLFRSDSDVAVRYQSAAALGYIGPSASSSAPQLGHLLHDRDTMVASYSGAALGRIGPRSVSALPDLIWVINKRREAFPTEEDPTPVQNAVYTLGVIGKPARPAVPYLIPLLKDGSVSRYVVKALGEIGDVSALPALERLHPSDGDPDLRSAISTSVARLKINSRKSPNG